MIYVLVNVVCTLTGYIQIDEVIEENNGQRYNDVIQAYLEEEKSEDQYLSYGYINFDLGRYFYDIFQNISYDITHKDLEDENLQLKEENYILKHYIQAYRENQANSLDSMLQLMIFLFIPSLLAGFCLSCRHKKNKTPIVIDVEPSRSLGRRVFFQPIPVAVPLRLQVLDACSEGDVDERAIACIVQEQIARRVRRTK